MIEATTSTATKNAFNAAHEARGAALTEFFVWIASFFKRRQKLHVTPVASAC